LAGRKLTPLRVVDCPIPAVLATIGYRDLYGRPGPGRGHGRAAAPGAGCGSSGDAADGGGSAVAGRAVAAGRVGAGAPVVAIARQGPLVTYLPRRALLRPRRRQVEGQPATRATTGKMAAHSATTRTRTTVGSEDTICSSRARPLGRRGAGSSAKRDPVVNTGKLRLPGMLPTGAGPGTVVT
jgi:hypothetical protein